MNYVRPRKTTIVISLTRRLEEARQRITGEGRERSNEVKPEGDTPWETVNSREQTGPLEGRGGVGPWGRGIEGLVTDRALGVTCY